MSGAMLTSIGSTNLDFLCTILQVSRPSRKTSYA